MNVIFHSVSKAIPLIRWDWNTGLLNEALRGESERKEKPFVQM